MLPFFATDRWITAQLVCHWSLIWLLGRQYIKPVPCLKPRNRCIGTWLKMCSFIVYNVYTTMYNYLRRPSVRVSVHCPAWTLIQIGSPPTVFIQSLQNLAQWCISMLGTKCWKSLNSLKFGGEILLGIPYQPVKTNCKNFENWIFYGFYKFFNFAILGKSIILRNFISMRMLLNSPWR